MIPGIFTHYGGNQTFVSLTCRLRVLVRFALGIEMITLLILVFSSHLESSSRVRSFSNLSRLSTWKGSRNTTLALPCQRGTSRTCTMFSMSSWWRYKPGREVEDRSRSQGEKEQLCCDVTLLPFSSSSELSTEVLLEVRSDLLAFSAVSLQLFGATWAFTCLTELNSRKHYRYTMNVTLDRMAIDHWSNLFHEMEMTL